MLQHSNNSLWQLIELYIPLILAQNEIAGKVGNTLLAKHDPNINI